jgi:predicted TIM-barrel fold metal-dependent hydrolase
MYCADWAVRFRVRACKLNPQGRELSDWAFDPVWEAAASPGAVIFIHPWGCSLGARLSSSYLGNTFGQPAGPPGGPWAPRQAPICLTPAQPPGQLLAA